MGTTPQLAGQTIVVIGGTKGIGLETARLARSEGADVIITARDPERLHRVGLELGASIAAFDATDFDRLGRFFDELPTPIDHVLVTGPGPYYAPLAELDFDEAHRSYDAHLLLPVQVARKAVGKVRPGGTLLFMSGTGGRRAGVGRAHHGAHRGAARAGPKPRARDRADPRQRDRGRIRRHPAFGRDTSATSSTRAASQLRATLPIGRVVAPDDIAALAVHLMTNTAITGATVDIDGGQQLLG